MPVSAPPADEYLTTRVLSASPAELHLMTVEGALRHARAAGERFAAGERDAAATSLAEARAFVTELLSGLNRDAAPDLVDGVASLFVFALRRLVEAELKPEETSLLEDAVTTLEAHRDAWREMLDAAPAVPAPATRPAAGTPVGGLSFLG